VSNSVTCLLQFKERLIRNGTTSLNTAGTQSSPQKCTHRSYLWSQGSLIGWNSKEGWYQMVLSSQKWKCHSLKRWQTPPETKIPLFSIQSYFSCTCLQCL